jgi:hypothetical protein
MVVDRSENSTYRIRAEDTSAAVTTISASKTAQRSLIAISEWTCFSFGYFLQPALRLTVLVSRAISEERWRRAHFHPAITTGRRQHHNRRKRNSGIRWQQSRELIDRVTRGVLRIRQCASREHRSMRFVGGDLTAVLNWVCVLQAAWALVFRNLRQ